MVEFLHVVTVSCFLAAHVKQGWNNLQLFIKMQLLISNTYQWCKRTTRYVEHGGQVQGQVEQGGN